MPAQNFKLINIQIDDDLSILNRELKSLGISIADFPRRLRTLKKILVVLEPEGSIDLTASAFLAEANIESRSVEGDGVRAYGESLLTWLNYLRQRKISSKDVSEPDMQDFRNSLIKGLLTKHPPSSSTVVLRVGTAIRFVEWAQQSQRIECPFGWQLLAEGGMLRTQKNFKLLPPTFVKNKHVISLPRIENKIPFPVDQSAMAGIYNNLPQPYKLMCKWAISTGLRRFEICNLTISDLPFWPISTSSTLIPISILRKGGKKHTIYAVPKLIAETVAYMSFDRPRPKSGHEDALFLNSRGNKVCKIQLTRRFRAAADKVGCRSTFHSLRHTFAINVLALLEKMSTDGCDMNSLKTLQVLMGHSSIDTTDIYLRSMEITSSEVESALGFLYGYGEKNES